MSPAGGTARFSDPAGASAVLGQTPADQLVAMLNAGVADVKVLNDEWTVVTADLKLSAHFEHSVAITADGPDVLSLVP